MKPKLILIGASTGGPGHLKKILSSLPSSFNGIVLIAQHMNSTFIPSFINQFQTELAFPVHTLDARTLLTNGHIYICAGHARVKSEPNANTLRAEPVEQGDTPYNPSIDTLFLSALSCVDDADILAVLLTGIGHDGAFGLSELQKKGARCIAESEKTAIVYGMPKRAVEINPQISSKPLDDIIVSINQFGAP
ncbi:MAG: CheB methylesterase domain-containing protein [Sulfurospirillum cavolei]|nr:CheB methylesterase domain-containing protein [Sulfurospirillum cavolei]